MHSFWASDLMQCIALVSCVSKKSSNSSHAKDLYQSAWFVKARAYVEHQGLDWYILSAKYGLLHPDCRIAPYEQTLLKTPAVLRKQWAEQVFQQCVITFPNGGEIQMFAGRYYREYLVSLLQSANYTVAAPLSRLGIGQQLSWFDQQLNH